MTPRNLAELVDELRREARITYTLRGPRTITTGEPTPPGLVAALLDKRPPPPPPRGHLARLLERQR